MRLDLLTQDTLRQMIPHFSPTVALFTNTSRKRLQRNYLFKKSVKTLRLDLLTQDTLRQMIPHFSPTVALFTNTSRKRLQRNYLFKKSVKTLRLDLLPQDTLRQMIPHFSPTVVLFTNTSRKRVDFVSAMLIEHRPPLTLCQKSLIIFSYILDAKYVFEIGRWIANLLEKWKVNSPQCCCLSR